MATKKLALVPAVQGEIVEFSNPTKAQADWVIDRWTQLLAGIKLSFLEICRLAYRADESQVWAQDADADGNPFTSFSAWVDARIPSGKTTIKQARTVGRNFAAVPDATLAAIPRVNLTQLAQLPENKRTQVKWLEAAKALPEREFKAQILKQLPEPELTAPPKLVKVSFKLRPPVERKRQQAFKRIATELDDPLAPPSVIFERLIMIYLDQSK